MMMENGDLTVEEVDTPRPLKPCFVAPPPPDEPPPEDGEVVSYSDIMGVKVDTVDIGTETSDDSTSFDQESPKSSPSMYKRHHEFCVVCSDMLIMIFWKKIDKGVCHGCPCLKFTGKMLGKKSF